LLAGGLVLAAQQRSFYQQTEYKGQAIGKLTGDIYYARMDDYVSVLLVTREGMVLVEPIGAESATWLGQADPAFSPAGEVCDLQPFALGPRLGRRGLCRYSAVYRAREHDHEYRAAARGHASMGERARRDKDGDGEIEPDEAQLNLKTRFALYDANHDGVIRGAGSRARGRSNTWARRI
jgi:hypothetical protein